MKYNEHGELCNDSEVISVYTRQQAIEDGVLYDTWADHRELCENAGFKIPICITTGVMHYVRVPDELKGIQDETGRLWDVLFLASTAFRSCLKGNPNNHDECRIVKFKILFTMGMQTKPLQELLTLWLVFNEHEGFTIMQPDEY